MLAAARIAVVLPALVLVVGFVWWHFPPASLGGILALGALFVVLVVIHSRAFDAKERALAAARFHQRGLARLDGTWRTFTSTGAAYASLDHPFADDLDVFGPSSLFQLLDATETPFGRDALGAWLSVGVAGHSEGSASSWQAEIVARHEALRELASEVAWREQLSVEGAVLRTVSPDPSAFLRWAEGDTPLEVPSLVVVFARVLPLLALAVLLVAPSVGWPKSAAFLVILVELGLSMRYREGVLSTLSAVGTHAGELARYGTLFQVAIAERRQATRLQAPLARLVPSGEGSRPSVVREMRSLERLVGFVEARNNEVFRLFIGPVLMWDLNFAILLERWRRRAGRQVRPWFIALGELEAFASLAGFTFDRPDHAWPQPLPDTKLEAEALGHPLIEASRRIGNDVTLPGPGTALVVTGSNMSGKSTLLRALGVNTVLAQAGAPVAARSFALGQVTLATSMRVRDSLEEGVSHFYAELQKLKRVVDFATKAPPLLFLLDEILHGTNSRERIIGARAVIRGLVERGALGAVSTHDLGIADLAELVPGAIRNVHFEEQVHPDGTMTFDYCLRTGTVQSSNALRLMHAIGLEVPIEEETQGPLPGPREA